MLVLLGCGVVANVALAKTKGFDGGFLMVTFGWGFAVFAGVIVAYASGAHINPAVTLGLVANSRAEFGNAALGLTVPVDSLSVSAYIGAQLIGAIIGAVDRLARLQAALRRGARPGAQARHLLDGPRHPQLRLEPRHRDHRHLRAGLRRDQLRPRATRRSSSPGARLARRAARRPARGRHRRLARWPDRVRDQPRPRPRPAHRARLPPDQGQGRQRLVLLLGTGRRPDHRRTARRSGRPSRSLPIITADDSGRGRSEQDRPRSRPRTKTCDTRRRRRAQD